MMNVLTLILAAATVAFQASAACITVYTLPPISTKSFSGGKYTYTGITNATDIQNYNNLMYYSLSSAKAATATPDGRLTGFLSLVTNTGTLAMEFFKTGSWATVYFRKGDTTPNPVTGGTGCFAGFTGTAVRTTAQAKPLIFQWDLCPQAAKTCASGSA